MTSDPMQTQALPTSTPGAQHGRQQTTVHGPLQALESLLRMTCIALFVVTFIVQPVVIPSESMEPTLMVGDFLLVDHISLALNAPWHMLLAARQPVRQQIILFRSPEHPRHYLIKRIVGIPGDHLRVAADQVWVNGQLLHEPYLEPQSHSTAAALEDFPVHAYTDPRMDLGWWNSLHQLVHDDQLTVPPGKYFVLGDNRSHSLDSRYWGFVDRDQIVATPILIYFSLRRTPTPELPGAQPANDRLGFDGSLLDRIRHGVRWSRLFQLVH